MRVKRYCAFCGSRLSVQPAEGGESPFCRHCNTPAHENPVPATCVVVVDDKERVLLVKRNAAPKQGMWCLPGGFMALAESPEQAALRELFEETGLTGYIERLLGVTSVSNKWVHTVVMIGYLVKRFQGELRPGDDAAEAAFFSYDSLPTIAFTSHQAFIRIYFAAYTSHC